MSNTLQPPFFVFEGPIEILIFTNIDDLENTLEPAAIANNTYEAYDAAGRRLIFSTAKKTRTTLGLFKREVDTLTFSHSEDSQQDAFKEKLIAAYRAHYLHTPAHLDTTQIQEKLIAYYGFRKTK